MTLTASGSANESGNVTNVCLAEDTGTIGQYNGESVVTGFHSGTRVQDSSTTAISNTTWATGNVTAAEGTNTTAIGPITAMNGTLVEIMQLNFSAHRGAVNITNITLKENGTATISGTGTNGIKNVSVWFDGTCYNNTQAALWTENGTLLLNLSHPYPG